MPEGDAKGPQRRLLEQYTFKGCLTIGGRRTIVRAYGCLVASMPVGMKWSARRPEDWEEAYGSLAERALPLSPWTPAHVLADLPRATRVMPAQAQSFIATTGGLIDSKGRPQSSHQFAAHARFHEELPEWRFLFEPIFERFVAGAPYASWQEVQDAEMGLALHLSLHEVLLSALGGVQPHLKSALGADDMYLRATWVVFRMLREQEAVLRAALKDPVFAAATSYRDQYIRWLGEYEEVNKSAMDSWGDDAPPSAKEMQPVFHSPFHALEGYSTAPKNSRLQASQQGSLSAWLARRSTITIASGSAVTDVIVDVEGASGERTYYLDWYADETQETPVLRERTVDWRQGRIVAALPLDCLLRGMTVEVRSARGEPIRLFLCVEGMPPGFEDRVRPVLPRADLTTVAIAYSNAEDDAAVSPAQRMESAWYACFLAAIERFETAAALARATGIPEEFRSGDAIPDGWVAARAADASGWCLASLLEYGLQAMNEAANPMALIDHAIAAREVGAADAQMAFDLASECLFLSPEVTLFGAQCMSLSSADGALHPIRLDPIRLGSDSAAVWLRRGRALGVDEHLVSDGGDIPAEPCGPYRSEPDPERLREIRELAASLIDEAIDHRAWTIPPNTLVEIELGRFRWIQLIEQPPMILVRLRDTLGHYVTVRLDTQERHWILYQRLSTDPREEAMILLGLSAVIRDFLVVDKTATGFRSERRRSKAHWQRPDNAGYVCVYLPRRRSDGSRHKPVEMQLDELQDGLERWRAGRRGGPVSGHVRRLPEGWSASDEQVLLSHIYGIRVPDGHTFVAPHERGDTAPKIFHRSRSAVAALLGAGFDTGIPSDDPWWTFEAAVRDALTGAGLESVQWAPALGRPGCLRILARPVGSVADISVVHAALPGDPRPGADCEDLLREDAERFAAAHPKIRTKQYWIGGVAGPTGVEVALVGPL